MVMMEQTMDIATAPTAKGMGDSDDFSVTPDRVSDTNVQVSGIDEPDIVKTNGTDIFLSSENRYYWREPDVVFSGEEMDSKHLVQQPRVLTDIIKAFPPEAL
ncbi:MAG: beta-propeller domain-containing protein, partial [Candidatus Pacebacteria bacterium]|nr:beta-propeller domain-containing protein [Candidatus Paceibacterota bacterium]